MTSEHTDILVIGGGPVGLYAAFYAGLRGLSVRLVEARPVLGGQLAALYPEKTVYDAPGFAAVRAADLVARLSDQLAPFSPRLALGETARGLARDGRGWRAATDRAEHTAGAVILTAGIGALAPRAVAVPGAAEFGRVETECSAPERFAGKRVLVAGGVPQATSAALALHAAGASATLAHRRALVRGTPEELARLEALRAAGEIDVRAPADLARFTPRGAEIDGEELAFDAAFWLNGYVTDLSPLRAFGLERAGEYVLAGPGQTTSRPGVFVAGDLSSSGGDFRLLAAGFAEAAVAANHAAHFVRPDLKVRPGHSSEKKPPLARRRGPPEGGGH